MATATKPKAKSTGPKAMKAVRVSIKSLKAAPWNPPTRLLGVGPLATNMEEHGQYMPILITAKNEMVDGHRRVAATKRLGWVHINAIVVAGQKANIFADVNQHTKKFTGNETLVAYLAEPNSVSYAHRKSIDEAVRVLGVAVVRRMANENLSMNTWNVARKIAKMADIDKDEFTKAALLWLLKFRNQQIVKHILKDGSNIGQLVSAVKRGKEIRAAGYVSA